MATFGSVNNTTTDAELTSGPYYNEGTWGATGGDLTEVSVFVDSAWAGDESYRFAIYTGGTATDPTGATKIWDSGQLTANISAPAWRGVVSGWGGTVSGSISAGAFVRFVAKINDAKIGVRNTDSDEGDWGNDCFAPNATNMTDNDSSAAFPTTWGTETGTGAFNTMKVILTYTESGGGSIGTFAMGAYAQQ